KDITIACIDKGIPVLIEKPIAESVQSAQKIINKSKKKKISVCIGHIERFNPVVQQLKKLIKQNRFGRIISISSKRVGLYPPQVSDVDVIIDLAVHDIDVCNFLLEKEPQSVYARAGKALNSKRFDYSDIFLNYNGVDVLLQVNWITPVKVRELTLTGIKCYAELSYLNQTLRLYKKGGLVNLVFLVFLVFLVSLVFLVYLVYFPVRDRKRFNPVRKLNLKDIRVEHNILLFISNGV
ncbi:unnamed protein product, partial [marine sediment metagenome]